MFLKKLYDLLMVCLDCNIAIDNFMQEYIFYLNPIEEIFRNIITHFVDQRDFK